MTTSLICIIKCELIYLKQYVSRCYGSEDASARQEPTRPKLPGTKRKGRLSMSFPNFD
jgi:hypothetical protein